MHILSLRDLSATVAYVAVPCYRYTLVFKGLTSAIEARLARLVERNPYLWKASWELVKKIPFLLPHDKSYNAFHHFIRCIPHGLFLDVGANDGITALGFRKLSGEYRILSLEPNPLLKPALDKVKRRDPLFDYRIIGAGSAPALVQLFMPVYRGIAMHTYTSGSLEQTTSALEEICGPRVAAGARIETMPAQIVTVDSLEVDPSIIKIDVEGFDYEVILGAARTIDRMRPFIAVEIAWGTSQSIQEFVRKRNYALCSYDVLHDEFAPSGPLHTGRNSFAIPQEWLPSLPVSRPARAAALPQ